MEEKKENEKRPVRGKELKTERMEAIRNGIDPVEKVNGYYMRLSVRYKIAKYALIVILVIFVLSMLSAYGSEITVEKFRYMLKDFEVSSLVSDGGYDSLVYNGDSSAKFGIYRGDFAVVTAGTTALYNNSGIKNYQQNNIFVQPHLLTSKKYMLVYDMGDANCSYAIYNSFDEQKKESFDQPIYSAAISDSGAYAILMSGISNCGLIKLYNSDLKLVTELRKDKYPVCASISKDGKKLYTASFGDENGEFVTEVDLVTPEGSERLIKENDRMPVSIQIMKNGSIAVIYTDSVVCYTDKAKEKFSMPLVLGLPAYAAANEEIICTVNNVSGVGNDKKVTVCSENGDTVYDGNESGELIAVRLHGKRVYLLFENRLTVIDTEASKSVNVEIEPNGMDVIVADDGTALVCYSGKAIASEIKF